MIDLLTLMEVLAYVGTFRTEATAFVAVWTCISIFITVVCCIRYNIKKPLELLAYIAIGYKRLEHMRFCLVSGQVVTFKYVKSATVSQANQVVVYTTRRTKKEISSLFMSNVACIEIKDSACIGCWGMFKLKDF